MAGAGAVRDSRRAKGLWVFWVAGAVIAVDQGSKFLVRSYIAPGASILAQGPFRLTHTTNTGGAFGILANQTFLLTLTAAVGVLALVLYLRYLPTRSRLLQASLGLELGGAAGNLVDRVSLGEVTDFIGLGWWPVFNLADSAIVIGIAVLACYLLFSARR